MRTSVLSRLGTLVLGVTLVVGCNEQRVGGGAQRDQIAPVVTIAKTAGDTLTLADGIKFSVGAADNLGLRSVSIALSGGFTTQIDSVFTSAVTSTTIPVDIPLPTNSTAGGFIVITAIAQDGNNNVTTAVDSVFLVNDQALTVTLLRPSPGAVTAPGRQILVEVRGVQRDGVARVGYTVAGNVTGGDSIGVGSPFPDTLLFLDTLSVPASAATGPFTVTGFAVDSAGRRATSTPVTVTIQSIQNDVTPPIVTVTVAKRVEVRDTIRVRATDPSGIVRIGWLATLLDNTTVVGGDSANFGGTLTEVSQSWVLNFNFATLPQNVIIRGFAIDANGNRGEARVDTSATSAIRRDTILVVHGITKLLPAGGRVADAIYNRNRNEFYLTNVDRNRLEVFQLVDTSFVPGGVPVGSKPWGIALWPRDTLGANGDTVVVANSGGTNFSIVDLGLRLEVRRHNVPNFLIQSVQTEIDQATSTIKIKITEFDFSDRPQYVGTFCLAQGGTACAPDSIYAAYSTTPTIDQGVLFQQRGTVRWENLTAGTPQSHFFWEQAEIAPSPESDTLQVLVDRGPALVRDTVLSAACGVTVDLNQLAFAESTFVRNSGNFTHALIGEGGQVPAALGFGRAVGYRSTGGIAQAACSGTIAGVTFSGRIERDRGISPAVRVRDFIANTAVGVRSVAVNFNGLTNLIRADSVYVLDENLRLMGIVGISGGNPGMDLNFNHAFDARFPGTPTFGGPGSPNDRLVFLARSDANIDVFDTYFYGRVATIPIRDPVIGPLRVARLPTGEQVLIGVTARGVVTVRLPPVSNIFPIRSWGEPIPETGVPER